ncbi:LINE-1 reverse transcriptase homolog [Pelobates cultripes]|uniref:LINE-1 reverse transcriptase homolog n=1 Tax=Pelobates cultripes TaxID=61616 RepID=A0AAD1RBF4_PELCU|nr:LINE-1 reverse transcriptase homolog [Pelobates cultripes]
MLANLYLPNKGPKASLASALKALDAFSEGTVIIRGDFNAPLEPRVGTLKGNSTIPDHVLRGMRTLLSNYQLADCWRTIHNAEKDYTYYLTPHKSYLRIDTSPPTTETWMH